MDQGTQTLMPGRYSLTSPPVQIPPPQSAFVQQYALQTPLTQVPPFLQKGPDDALQGWPMPAVFGGG